MSDEISLDECAQCGVELGDEYVVHKYGVENPVTSGYINMFHPMNLLYELRDEKPPLPLEVKTCNHCDAPDKPPAADESQHWTHLKISSTFALFGWWAILNPTPETSILTSIGMTILFVGLSVGEYLQITRIREREKPTWEREGDVEPILADDEEKTAREAFLDGEIDEEELEARLDDEFADDETRSPERVIDR